MTTQQECKKYTFNITYRSRLKYRTQHQIETCTFSTIQPSAEEAINKLVKKFEAFTILKVTPEKPSKEFETVKIPHQEPVIKNPRVAFPGMKSSEPVVTRKVVKRTDGTKVCVTSQRKYTRAELLEILMKMGVL